MEKGIKQKANKKENNKKIFNIKSYIRDFLLFVDKYLMKSIKILLVISILIVAISIQPLVTSIPTEECVENCVDKTTIWRDYSDNIQVIAVTVIAGIVPYMYAPIVGFLGYVFSETAKLAYLVKDYGFLRGSAVGIVPLILNIVIICVTVSLGIYICRTVTVGYKISNLKNMNFTNFKIKLYEVLKKEDKVKKLEEKKKMKMKKLQDKKEKLNYLQILNVSIVVVILQLVSVLIQHILI